MGNLQQWSYARIFDTVAFAVFSSVLLSWIVYFSFIQAPAFFTKTGDPDCVYASNAILLAERGKVIHTDHPGTIVQAIGAGIAFAVGIDKDQIFEPESYIWIFQVWRVLVIVAIILGFIKLWKTTSYGSSGYIAFPCIFLFGTTPAFGNIIFFQPEAYYLSIYLLFLLYGLTFIRNEKVLTWRKCVAFGIAAGLLSTAKYLLFPVILYLGLLVSLRQKGDWKRKIYSGALFFIVATVAFFGFSGAVSADFMSQLHWVYNLAANVGGEYGRVPVEAGRMAGVAGMLFAHLKGPDAVLNLIYIVLPCVLSLFYIQRSRWSGSESKDPGNTLFHISPVICVGVVYALFFIHPRSLHYLLPAYLIAGTHLTMISRSGNKRFQPAYICVVAIMFVFFVTGLAKQTKQMRYNHYRDQLVEERCNEAMEEYSNANVFFDASVAQSVNAYKLVIRDDPELEEAFEKKYGRVYRNYNFEKGNIEDAVLPSVKQPTLFIVRHEIESDHIRLLDHIETAHVYIYYYEARSLKPV